MDEKEFVDLDQHHPPEPVFIERNGLYTFLANYLRKHGHTEAGLRNGIILLYRGVLTPEEQDMQP